MSMKYFINLLTLNCFTIIIFININLHLFSTIQASSVAVKADEQQKIWLLNRLKRSGNETLYSLPEKSCQVDLLQCLEEEICRNGFCQCKEGYIRSDDSCQKSQFEGKSCEIGLSMCKVNENCKPLNKRRKNGVCECREGFIRNKKGNCYKMVSSISNSLNESFVPITLTTGVTKFKPTLNVDSTISNVTTIHPLQDSTESIILTSFSYESVSQSTEKIIVNINNKTIYLPTGVSVYTDWTTLSAYAIGDSKSNYKFTWTLVNKPDSKEDGAIKDMNTPTVSLSNLVAGIYIFKVTVIGTNAYGDATGNITVLPALHINKPPTAVIVPSSQTVKLPNSVVIIDGSGSSDDTKIVSFLWELIMGPLGYKLQESSGPTLQMKDLIPGNYTIMYSILIKLLV